MNAPILKSSEIPSPYETKLGRVSIYIMRKRTVPEPAATCEAMNIAYISLLSITFAPKLTCQLDIASISPKR